MKKDWLFAPHYRYYVREMRILAYSQLLESYRSLTLGYMAEAFGVSTEFIDQCVHVCYHVFKPVCKTVTRFSHTHLLSFFLRELSRFIAAGRLHCKIDKVNEIVETNR